MVDNLVGICRDDNCDEEDIHPEHDVPRRRSKACKRKAHDWDPKGLRECVKKAIHSTEWPLVFAEIKHEVLNDFGTTTDRAIHRHLERLEGEREVVTLELGLAFACYIKPTSRFRHDLANLREHVLGKRSMRSDHKSRVYVPVVEPVVESVAHVSTAPTIVAPEIILPPPPPHTTQVGSVYMVTSSCLDSSGLDCDAICYWRGDGEGANTLAIEQSERTGATWRVLKVEVVSEFSRGR